jgi:sugar phosphate isomerase/epimerase
MEPEGGRNAVRQFKVGIDSYTLKPLGLSPFELVDWAVMNGADGVQFSEVSLPPGEVVGRSFLEELKGHAARNALYLEWGGGEHIPVDLATGKKKEIFPINRKAAEQASLLGVSTIRSCSGGLMRWKKGSPRTDEFLGAMAVALKDQKSMLRDHGVVLAIETHFEFTSFELLRLFEMCGAQPGEYLGICLDTMNLLTMLEDPVSATERLLPWVVTTHVKDGGLLLADDGFVSFTAEAGKGVVDLAEIFETLSGSRRDIRLTLEDHGGDFRLPVFDPEFLAEFPDLTAAELVKLLGLANRTRLLIEKKKLAVLAREDWPGACEKRAKSGLRALRRIVEEGKTRPPSIPAVSGEGAP